MFRHFIGHHQVSSKIALDHYIYIYIYSARARCVCWRDLYVKTFFLCDMEASHLIQLCLTTHLPYLVHTHNGDGTH